MFYNAILSLIASIFLPFFVAEANSRRKMQETLLAAPPNILIRCFNKLKVHLASLWAASHMLFAVCMFATLFVFFLLTAILLLMLSLQLLFWCLWRYSVHHAGRVFMGSQSVGSICFGTYFNFLVTRELT